ncbi:MAG: cytochrome P450 [bacterium]|nr:cytochrome P450 [bacterium]MCY3890678.1 cytochrome P450 [bacterium]MCY4136470.1 cytochrome P450 [bacterium]MDE0603869.1 cytochrome P450 [bacterium]
MATAEVTQPVDLLDGYMYAQDPFSVYAWLRENDPVYWDEKNEIWGVSRHADLLAVEKNTDLYSSASGSRPKIEMSDSMINMDDPDHQRQRMLVAREFTPRAVRRQEDKIRAVVTELIDRVAPRGWCDVVYDLAAPLPAYMIGKQLGYPTEMWPRVMHWSEATMQGGGGPGYHTVQGDRAIEEWAGTTYELVQKRKADPQDDLISMWCHKELDGQPLSDDDIMHEVLLVLDGGAETTRTVIGTTCLALVESPDQRQILIDEPEVIGETAVEEFIRYVSPILNMRRTVTATHELHGKTLKEGDQVLLMYASANRDPEAFENPDALDVRRDARNHLSFGFGTHFCLGASLARLQLKVMFEEVTRRLPDMRLEPFYAPRYRPGAFTRGLEGLNVEFAQSEPEGDGALGMFPITVQ